MVNIGNDWDLLLREEFDSPYYKKLRSKLIEEYRSQEVFPPMEYLFEALKRTSFEDTRAVILGQDPYHGPGQAQGLAFSVGKGQPLPPSLNNIYEEISREYGYEVPGHGDLSSWTQQGVLLLNTSLSVRRGQAGSHSSLGWQRLTGRILELLGESPSPRVFMLWGNHARSKRIHIRGREHLVLEAPHPSPLSAYRGFFGCNHFKIASDFLEEKGRGSIDWRIV